MNALPKLIAISFLVLQMVGCATTPVAVKPVVLSGDSIAVIGFVKAPGRYSYHDGMTVAEALRDAGGYDRCKSCQAFYRQYGEHPTFDLPPKVQREGQMLQLPKPKAEWMQFILQRDDEIKFRHIMF